MRVLIHSVSRGAKEGGPGEEVRGRRNCKSRFSSQGLFSCNLTAGCSEREDREPQISMKLTASRRDFICLIRIEVFFLLQ